MICTPQEVADHAGHPPPSEAEASVIADQIAIYQAELEAELGRGVELLTRTEQRPWPMRTDRLYVRRGPIASVTGVAVGGLALEPAAILAGRDHVEVYAAWTAVGTTIAVTYVGGWGPPDNLPAKGAVKARTARWLNRREDDDVGVESSSVEGHSVKWSDDAFTEAELRACSRLRAPDQAG